MNHKDTLEAAQKMSQTIKDSRVTQFYDPSQKSGKILSRHLPLNAEVAWDIYLFYGKDKLWEDHLSDPIRWMHQMSDTDPDSKHLRCGDDLVEGLYDSMKLIAGSS